MATSVPAPMAIPVSARVSAGASLIPSPTMATLPHFCSSRITDSFPSGRTPAITLSTPAWLPMALAVLSLSPVSMTTSMPIFCISLTAWAESSLMTSATAIMPVSFPSLSKNRGVFPCTARSRAFARMVSGISVRPEINFSDPP